MLKILNDLEPFFKDNYERINIRQYSRIKKISPPSASSLLNNLKRDKLLICEKDRNYIYYYANKESEIFIELSRVYWLVYLRNSGLIDYLERELITPLIILFGSFSKAEIKYNSDIDLAIFTISEKTLNLESFEKKLKRKIQLFVFRNREGLKNKELLNSILNGFIILGSW